MYSFNIEKVSAIPAVLKPDTIYLLLTNGTLEIHVSNNTGTALMSPDISASLVNGQIPSDQLPNFIDIRSDAALFPTVGSSNMLYMDISHGASYIWDSGSYHLLGTTTLSALDVTVIPSGNFDSTNLQAVLESLDTKKAPLESPAFTGTVTGITKTMVGLSQVNNTSDMDKPISYAVQEVLDGITASIDGNRQVGFYYDLNDFPTEGIIGVLYIDTLNNKSYLWGDTGYTRMDLDRPIPATDVTYAPTAPMVSTTVQTAIKELQDSVVTSIANQTPVTKDSLGLGLVDNTADATKPISGPVQTAIDALKVDIAAAGTVSQADMDALKASITAQSLGLGLVDNTTDATKPISAAVQAALDALSAKVSGGGNITAADIAGIQASITKESLGLGNVNNTSDATKPISGPVQTALDALVTQFTSTNTVTQADLDALRFSITKETLGLGSVDNTSDINKPISAAVQAALDAKVGMVNGTAPVDIVSMPNMMAFPTTGDKSKLYIDENTNVIYRWTGSQYQSINEMPVKAIDVSSVPFGGLSATNVQAALQELDTEKASANNPVFTGTIAGITKDMIGLGSVDNTSDLAKPISTAAQAALDTKPTLVNGVITPSQLPSFVSDIYEMPTLSAFPTPGIDGKIYIAIDTNLTYRWTGTSYVPVGMAAGDIFASIVQVTPLGGISSINVQAALQELDTEKAPLDSPAFTGTVTGITKTMVGLSQVDNTSDLNKPISSLTAADLALKAPLASPAFTGTVTGISKSMVGLGAVDNTTDLDKPISTATQAALTALGTANGTVTAQSLGLENVENTTDLNKPVSTATQIALNLKANIASPAFTGTVTGISKGMVGLGQVDNTTDLNKPISTATQIALDAKVDRASPAFTGTVTGITKAMVGLGNVDNTSDLAKPVSTATQTALNAITASAVTQASLDLKANIASPTFTGTVGGISKAMVGLGSADNTSDATKFTNTALTGTPTAPTAPAGTNTTQLATTAFVLANGATGVTKSTIGLGSVDNTSDLAKPISTATQTALDLKANILSPALTGTPTAPTAAVGTNSTQLATTAFVLANGLSLASPAFTGTPTAPTAAVGTNTTQLATTAFVLANATTATKASIGLGNVDNTSDLTKFTSTALTGTPTAPTAGVGTNTTQVATTAFVLANASSLTSPAFTGTPTAPTAAVGTNSTQLATTAFVVAADALKANIASPTLTGTPSAPTAAIGTNTTQLATTAFVIANGASGVTKASIGLGNVDNTSDLTKFTNTALTGTPSAPTAGVGTNTTQVATTAFVLANASSLSSPAFTGTPTAPTAAVGTNTTQLATTAFVVAADALKANIASPTLTGTPSAPTAAVGTNTTQLATTAFVLANGLSLVSPAFTGTPSAPTAAVGTNTTQLATTAFVIANAGTAGLALKANLTGATFTGNISAPLVYDAAGEMRTVPQSTAAGAVVPADHGKFRVITTGITINSSTSFTPGQNCTLYANTTSATLTITGTGVTMYIAGNATAVATAALKGRGMCTIFCTASGEYILAGNVS